MNTGFGLPSPQQTNPHQGQDRPVFTSPRQPSSQQGQAARPPRRQVKYSEVHRSQQLRQLRQILLHAVRADQQGQQTDSSTLRLISEITGRVDGQHAALLERGSTSSEDASSGGDSELKAKVYGSIAKLSQGLLERETEVDLLGPEPHFRRPQGYYQSMPK